MARLRGWLRSIPARRAAGVERGAEGRVSAAGCYHGPSRSTIAVNSLRMFHSTAARVFGNVAEELGVGWGGMYVDDVRCGPRCGRRSLEMRAMGDLTSQRLTR